MALRSNDFWAGTKSLMFFYFILFLCLYVILQISRFHSYVEIELIKFILLLFQAEKSAAAREKQSSTTAQKKQSNTAAQKKQSRCRAAAQKKQSESENKSKKRQHEAEVSTRTKQ